MSSAILGYGYDLGPACQNIREIDGNGKLTLSWLPPGFVNGVDEEGERALVTAAQRRLLEPPADSSPDEAADWEETFRENAGWFGLDEAVETATGVRFVPYGSDRWALCAHRVAASEKAKPVSLSRLSGPEKADAWTACLSKALGRLGMTPAQTGPCWLLLAGRDDL